LKKLYLLILLVTFALSLISGCGRGKGDGGTIVGKVNDTFHGGGVDGAKVSLTSNGLELTTTTDKSGNFTFSGLPPGFYTVVVTKDGFFDNRVEPRVEAGKETKVDIGLIVAFGGT